MKDMSLFPKVKVLSNKLRFKIVELTQNKQLSITVLSSKLKLSYTKCADYVTMLEKEGLVEKVRDGKEVKVRSKVRIGKDKIEFK
jgi:predicted transcriptional regulator